MSEQKTISNVCVAVIALPAFAMFLALALESLMSAEQMLSSPLWPLIRQINSSPAYVAFLPVLIPLQLYFVARRGREAASVTNLILVVATVLAAGWLWAGFLSWGD